VLVVVKLLGFLLSDLFEVFGVESRQKGPSVFLSSRSHLVFARLIYNILGGDGVELFHVVLNLQPGRLNRPWHGRIWEFLSNNFSCLDGSVHPVVQ
jgi:hypothetical protein